ncbi:MAG TPA: FecR domain-containing protein [Allosphingosinicella sp.]|jgi:transmembrane sensor|uniref:FecR family protein n=1 Tax=Allosphingosinicella sp. TaxID=2823234 RepID=UPI002F28AE82
MVWPFVSRRERLRREASDWIARLNGPIDETDRAEFERWYHASPAHAAAYERLTLLFDVASGARRPQARSAPLSAPRGSVRPRSYGYAVAGAAACAALLAFVLLAARPASPPPEGHLQMAAYSATDDASRRILLLDGSEILLSPGTHLEVALGRRERRLRLVRGEGRFSVAHEARPFIVVAEATQVIARGTRFVVRISTGQTTVSLIDGRVDVTYASLPDRRGARRVTRLERGQQLVVRTADEPRARPHVAPLRAEMETPAAHPMMLQFDNTPLEEAVERVNRHGRPQVRLDRALADLRVTGAFHAGDTLAFAQSIAAAFDLEVERGPEASLLLRRGLHPSSPR